MKNLLLISVITFYQLSFGQYLLTDGSNFMTGGLYMERESYAFIELKSNTGSFIDFHSTIAGDYDGRIIWNYLDSDQFDIYGITNFKDRLISPIVEVSNEIRVAEGFDTSDPTIGTFDNSGYGINIDKTDGIGFLLSNQHKMIIEPNGDIHWGNSGASLTTNQGAAIELRGTGVPFVDFSNDPSVDYDIRMILRDDDFLEIAGGSVGIGTQDGGNHKLAVEGSIGAREVKVQASGWSDFVFEEDYELKALEWVEKYIRKYKHLPEIPSEEEVMENGINLGEMDAKLLQKIEELLLYTIEQEKKISKLEEENRRFEQLEKRIAMLEKRHY